MIDLNLNPQRKDLRIFAALFWVFFTGVSYVVSTRTESMPVAASIAAVAAAVGIVGLCIPQYIRPVYVIWMLATYPIGWVMSHVIMGIIFYLVITPIGLMMRGLGRDPMHRAFDKHTKSYWISRSTEERTERYFRQF
jgi:fatty acid desaturase